MKINRNFSLNSQLHIMGQFHDTINKKILIEPSCGMPPAFFCLNDFFDSNWCPCLHVINPFSTSLYALQAEVFTGSGTSGKVVRM